MLVRSVCVLLFEFEMPGKYERHINRDWKYILGAWIYRCLRFKL